MDPLPKPQPDEFWRNIERIKELKEMVNRREQRRANLSNKIWELTQELRKAQEFNQDHCTHTKQDMTTALEWVNDSIYCGICHHCWDPRRDRGY